MKGEIKITFCDQTEADNWIKKQGDRIFNVSTQESERVYLISDGSKDIEVWFDEHSPRQNTNWFPQDNYGSRGTFGKFTY